MALEMDMEGYVKGPLRSTPSKKKRSFSTAFFGFGCVDDVDVVCERSKRHSEHSKSVIEDLPDEILKKILCGVEHDDLKSLFHVSKTIREATLLVKQSHFAYKTPRRCRDNINKIVPPNAPKKAPRSRLSTEQLASISVALFVSVDGLMVRPGPAMLL